MHVTLFEREWDPVDKAPFNKVGLGGDWAMTLVQNFNAEFGNRKSELD